MRRLTFIVPTLGKSPLLDECLAALRRDAGPDDAIWVVDQGLEGSRSIDCDRRIRTGKNLGFAGGCNEALRQVDSEYAALINDDAVIDPSWGSTLIQAFEAHPKLGSAQSLNLQMNASGPPRIDGAGIAWNSWWQAVQLGHDQPASEYEHGTSGQSKDVFGVSATAAVYRMSSLRSVALARNEVFDRRLFAYYEDVDLAVRLRAAGFTARCESATAHHAGSATGGSMPAKKIYWLTRNRLWVLARLLGRDFSNHLHTLRVREIRDGLREVARLRLRAASARVAGWNDGRRGLHDFAHTGPPLIDLSELVSGCEVSAS